MASKNTLAAYALSVSLAAAGAVVPLQAQAASTYDQQRASAAGMFFDAALIRPVSLVATALGVATFVVSLPFSALGGNAGEAAKQLVVEPAKTTFVRPLGRFD